MAKNTTAVMGTVGTPEKGANGAVKVYVHDCTVGAVGLIYRPANMVELGDALYSMVGDSAALLETVRTLLTELDEKAAIRVASKPATPVVDETPLTPPAPVVVTPAPVVEKPYPIMTLPTMTPSKVATWLTHKWTDNAMRFNLRALKVADADMPTLTAFIAGLTAAHTANTSKGEDKPATPAAKPAPVKVAAQTVAAPKVETPKVATATPAPVSGKVYGAADELKGDDVKALASKLGITLVEGRGAFMKNRATVWAAYSKGQTVSKAANAPQESKPATVSQTVAAPVVSKAPTFKAGTLLVADGNGGVRIATESDVQAWMDTVMGAAS